MNFNALSHSPQHSINPISSMEAVKKEAVGKVYLSRYQHYTFFSQIYRAEFKKDSVSILSYNASVYRLVV